MDTAVLTLEEELNEILRRREHLIQQRDATQDPTEHDQLGMEIEINTRSLRSLSKRCDDARNATRRHGDRKRLKALGGRISGLLSGIGVEGESDISPRYEQELLEGLHQAKTNSERRRINAKLRQLHRDRNSFASFRNKVSPA
jgi:hypothetical protein